MGAIDRATPPPVGPPPAVHLPTAQVFRLSNGLPVVTVGRHGVPVVNVTLQILGGGWEVAAERAGLAAFTSDLLDEGTETRSALEIAEALERLGAGWASMAGRDASTVRMGVVRPRFEEALEVFGEVLTRPTFPAAEVDRVRTEQLTRILQGNAEPRVLADEALARVLYGDVHPYGQPVLGTRDTVEGLTREDALAFYESRYRPGHATLIVTGDVTRESIEPLLEATLRGWRGGGLPEVRHAEPAPAITTTIYLVDRPGAPQSEVRVGRLSTDRRTPDYFPLTVLNTVLGGSFTSRLNMRLREEKGFTYGARSSFALRRRIGPFVAGAAVHTPVTGGAVVEFLEEIRRLTEAPVPAAELVRAKNYVALRLPQGFETAADLSTRLSELVLNDLPMDYYDGYVDAVLAVTAEDVLAAARRYLAGGLTVVVVGDRAAVEEPLRALGVGDVVALEPSGPSSPQS